VTQGEALASAGARKNRGLHLVVKQRVGLFEVNDGKKILDFQWGDVIIKTYESTLQGTE
jgi:hypothetical protein